MVSDGLIRELHRFFTQIAYNAPISRKVHNTPALRPPLPSISEISGTTLKSISHLELGYIELAPSKRSENSGLISREESVYSRNQSNGTVFFTTKDLEQTEKFL